MTDKVDRFWTAMAGPPRPPGELPPATMEQVQADVDRAGELPVSESLVESITARTLHGARTQAGGPLAGSARHGRRRRVLYTWIAAGAAIAAGVLLAVLTMQSRSLPKAPVSPGNGAMAPMTIAEIERRANREQAAACLLASAEMLQKYAGGREDARKTLEYVQSEYADTTAASRALRAAETQAGGV